MAALLATATGTLGSTPLANLLIYALDRRLSGTLVLEDSRSKKSAVAFRAGAPAKVKLGESVARLRDVLVELRLVDAEVAAEAEAEAKTQKKLLGQVLLARGAVDAAVLSEALEEQIFRRIEWLCRLSPETVYGYYDGADLLSAYGSPEGAVVEPLAVTWRAIRLLAAPAAVDATLTKLGGRELRLHPQSRAAKFQFDSREQAVVDVLRAKPQTIANLIATGLLPERETKKVVYALVVTRHLDLGSGVTPVGGSEQSLAPPPRSQAPVPRRSSPAEGHVSKAPPAIPVRSGDPAPGRESSPVSRGADAPSHPRSTAPRAAANEAPSNPQSSAPRATANEAPSNPQSSAPRATASEAPSNPQSSAPRATAGRDEAFVAEIREAAQSVGGKDHYQVLGVERDAAVSVIQAAFFRLAKRWHPDRLGTDYADVRDLAMRVFARMTEAHQTLSSDEQRREYDRLLQTASPSAEQEEVQRVLRAATAFQKAEVFAKRGNAAEAEKQAQIAVENDPEQAEYMALYAEVLSQNPERQKSGNFTDLVRMVNAARKRQPDNLKVRLYRARVLGRSGDADSAYREFRNIAEQDAHNVEAAREVRLYDMRRGKKTTDPRKSVVSKETDARRTQPKPTEKDTKAEAKGPLNQDIGQIFGKIFKR